MTDRTAMELDGCEATGNSLEPGHGAIAEPHWLWGAIAAEEPPTSVETEDARNDPNAGPDTGSEHKSGGPEALSGDDQRDGSGLAGTDGEFAKLRHMIQESAERVENEAFGKLALVEAQTKTLAEAVAANAAALQEFAGAEGRQPETGGTSEPGKDENRNFLADFHRWADAQRGYRLWWSALALAVVVPAFFLLGVLVELQFEIVPRNDPSGGWSRHIWDNYGPAIADCAMEAKRTDRAVKCSFDIRKP